MAGTGTISDRREQSEVERRRRQRGRGREATRPSNIPARGWKDILSRVWGQVIQDRITLVAAGATFYILLALLPALAAFVSIYGFVADPGNIADHISYLSSILPSGGMDLVRSQLEHLASQNRNALSFGFALGLCIALWSANNGMKALFEAMNIAYEENEKRGFLRLHLLTLTFAVGAILVGIGFIVLLGVVPAILAALNLTGSIDTLVKISRWPALLVVLAVVTTLVYRYGPSREKAQLPWYTWGAALATVVWLAASIAFSYYLENFATSNVTYGTLGALIGFMMWIWLSVVILLVGAELNAEMEHQTARDTTTGEPEPIGKRGATMADTIGRSVDSH